MDNGKEKIVMSQEVHKKNLNQYFQIFEKRIYTDITIFQNTEIFKVDFKNHTKHTKKSFFFCLICM